MRLVIPITGRLPELFMEATLAHHASLSAQEEPELEPASQKKADESSGPQPGSTQTARHRGMFAVSE